MLKKIINQLFAAFSFVLIVSFFVSAQQKVPSPAEVIGFTPGDDRKLASWNQVLSYFQKLEDTSPRVKFEAIGKTTMDAPFAYATISSPQNLKDLERYRSINAKLADPRLIKSDDKLAKKLIADGKAIVLITCGIHSTEVGSTLSSMLIAHRLATSDEPMIRKILDETIILLVPSLNPDGVDIIKNWYDKTVGTPYEGSTPPELYHKYIGHDNNRDWYAFTQIETKLTVDKIHNAWRPQIVNDIHQQGANGARLFIPPYMQPVEPNVPKDIIEGYTELGNFVADDMRNDGFQGITTNSTYDAWTPARAYSHYHGGVRILTETASARMASPTNVPFDRLRGSEGYDAKVESPNHRPVWKGGDWKLRDITNYMTASTFALLKHASTNREKWLTRFYSIGKEAVRPRKPGELNAFVVGGENFNRIEPILKRGGVEYRWFQDGDKLSVVVPMDQPYGAFAKALLERQKYPDLLDKDGNPIRPYDVTAHTISLLMDVNVTEVNQPRAFQKRNPPSGATKLAISECEDTLVFATYKSYVASMDEGWTRWVFENFADEIGKTPFCSAKHQSAYNSDLKAADLNKKLKAVVFPDQSTAQILNGHAKGTMPDEFVGGLGKDGVQNLRTFVENGGTLIFMNRSADFAIEQFGLPLRNVTKGLAQKDFFIPGSILRTRLSPNHPITKGQKPESIAWFENSPAFEILDSSKVETIASYPTDPKMILLSGWALGADKLAGKAAAVSVKIGSGKIVLFGFRPQYRGQSIATFPLLFEAIRSN